MIGLTVGTGHGGQTPDTDGDEEDGYDEVISPVDFRSAGHIVDDEMHRIMVKPLQPCPICVFPVTVPVPVPLYSHRRPELSREMTSELPSPSQSPGIRMAFMEFQPVPMTRLFRNPPVPLPG